MNLLKHLTGLFLIIFIALAISCKDDKPAVESTLVVFMDAYGDTTAFDASLDKNLHTPLLKAIKGKEGKDLHSLKVIVYPLHAQTASSNPVAEIDIDEALIKSIRGTNIVGQNKYNKLWNESINKRKAGIPDETNSCRIFKSLIPLSKRFAELSDEYEKVSVLYISDMVELDIRDEEKGRYSFLDSEKNVSSSSIEMATKHMNEDKHELNKMLNEFNIKCPSASDSLHVFILKPGDVKVGLNIEGKGSELIDAFWEEFFREGLKLKNVKSISAPSDVFRYAL